MQASFHDHDKPKLTDGEEEMDTQREAPSDDLESANDDKRAAAIVSCDRCLFLGASYD